MIQSVFSDADLLSVSIIRNPIDNSGNMLYRFVTAQKQISLIAKPYDLLDDLIMLNMRRDVAISSQSVFLRMNTFISTMEKKYPGYIWPEDLLETLQAEKQQRKQWLYLPSKTSNNAISFCVNTLLMSNGNHIVLFLITPERLNAYLKTDDPTDIVIYSPDNHRLTGDLKYDISDEKLFAIHDSAVIEGENNERFFVKATHSSVTNHMVYAITPYTPIEAIISSMKYMNTVYLLISIFITLSLCAIVTWVNMKPLDGILRFLFGHDAKAITRALNWKNIDERIHELFQKNNELVSDLEHQKEALVNSYLNALIIGREPNVGHTLQRLEQLNIPLQASYHVILMSIHAPIDATSLASFSLLIHRHILACFTDIKTIMDVSSRCFLMLIQSDEDYSAVENQFDAFQENLDSMLQVSATGCYFHMDSIDELAVQYWNAVTSLEMHRDSSQRKLLMPEDSQKTGNGITYPQGIEQDIIFAITTGNKQLMEDSLKKLYELNTAALLASTISSQLLWEQLSATIVIALTRMKSVPETFQLKTILSTRRLICTDTSSNFTHQIMNIMIPVFILTKQEHEINQDRSVLGQKIIEYIQANLSNPDLCLQMISDHFSFSGAYISSLIKNETGQGFAVYCEHLRIANACKMLKENVKIQEVAESVGYNSVHSFRRAFKKVLGILPSQYT